MCEIIEKFGHPDHPKYLVTLPHKGSQTSHARVNWCEQRVGKTYSGAWNYWDFDTKYWFTDLHLAWEFYLTWS